MKSINPIPVRWKRTFFKESDSFEKYGRHIVVELEILGKIIACRIPVLFEIRPERSFMIFYDAFIEVFIRRIRKSHEFVNGRRLGFSFDRNPIELTEDEMFGNPFGSLFREYDIGVVYFVHSFESGSEIHRVSYDGIIGKSSISDISNRHLTCGDSKADIEGCSGIFLKYTRMFVECFLYEKSGRTCCKRMILMPEWSSPKCENRIPDIFIDGSVIFEDDPIHDMEKMIEYLYNELGIEAF